LEGQDLILPYVDYLVQDI